MQKKSLSGVGDIVADLQAGKSLKESGIAALKKTGKEMFSDATRQLNLQKGSGVRKRRKPRKKKPRKPRKQSDKKRKGVKGKKRGRKSRRNVLSPS